MQKIVPCLWFATEAEDAMNYYLGIFKDSKAGEIMRYGDAGPQPAGSVLTVSFTLNGVEYMALNGGNSYPVSPAVSFFVHCSTQEEVDHLWDSLSEGGQVQQCGWLTDKFGVTWQIVPTVLGNMMRDKDAAKVKRVTEAMFTMKKLDIARLQQAYDEA